MNEINLQFVREFFELNMFRVLTHWQHENLPQISDFSSLLFVEHTDPGPGDTAEFVLRAEEVNRVRRAVVEVRAWHADRFYPSLVEGSPILGHVAFDVTRELGDHVFGGEPFETILIISELPQSPAPRQRSIQLLGDYGIDHVLEFSTILRYILNRISPHGNYAPSQTLQTMRLLKRYSLIADQQMEFGFRPEPLSPAKNRPVSPKRPTETEPEEEIGDEDLLSP